MNKIVNGVANDYEFPNLYDPNISYSKAYTEQLLAEKDKEIEELNNLLHKANDEVVSYANECIRLNNIIKSIKEELKVYIEITIDHLETNNEEINFELRNKCRAMREIKEELLNIIEKELKEGKE